MDHTTVQTGGRVVASVIGAALLATMTTASAMALPAGGQGAGASTAATGAAATSDVQLVGGRHHHNHHRHGFHHRYAFYGAPVYVRPSGCGWLKVKAVETSSRYWWRRYRDCID
jgi:tryptophan synthase beta subunit